MQLLFCSSLEEKNMVPVNITWTTSSDLTLWKFSLFFFYFRCSAFSLCPHQQPCYHIRFFLSYVQVTDLSDKSMNCFFSVHWPLCLYNPLQNVLWKAYQFWTPKESKCGKEENYAAMRLLLQTIWSIQCFNWVIVLCVSHCSNYMMGEFMSGQKLEMNPCKTKEVVQIWLVKLSSLCLFWQNQPDDLCISLGVSQSYCWLMSTCTKC